MKRYGFRTILFVAPSLAVWVTLMIATPIAVSFRYLSSLMFALPLVLIVPEILKTHFIDR